MFEVGSETKLKQATPAGAAPSHATRNAKAGKAGAHEAGRPEPASAPWLRALGNRAIGRMQAKLEVNQPGDAYENKALNATPLQGGVLRVGEQTGGARRNWEREVNEHPIEVKQKTAIPEASQGDVAALQRKCADGHHTTEEPCADCGKQQLFLQQFASDSAPRGGRGLGSASSAGIPPPVQRELQSPGQPLMNETREFMEARFRRDFSKVRVHTNESAADSARAVHALAYTVGDHIVFGAGQYAPGSHDGARLLAHELTHVLQQRSGGTSAHASDSVYEANANSAAEYVLGNSPSPPPIVPAGITLAREPDQKGRKSPAELIAKANAEIDRLREIAKQKGDKLALEDTQRAYDAVHSVVLAATSGKDIKDIDEGFLDQARDVKAKYDSIVRNTPADKPHPFTPHPAASPDPMSQEEASRAVIAQRGFDADLNPQRIQEARDEIERKQKRLDEIRGQLQSADDGTKAKLEAEAQRLRKEVAAANSRIAMSRPTLIDAEPEELRAEKQKLEKELAEPKTTEAKRNKLQERIEVLDEQIRALTSGEDKVPLSALQGGRLGDADHSKFNRLRDQKAELEDRLKKATSDAEQKELQIKISALDAQMMALDRYAYVRAHDKTYVTVQVLGPDGKLVGSTLQARNDPANNLHAEDIILQQLRKLPDKSVLKGATIVISGDQVVCPRCVQSVHDFAKDYPDVTVVGDTAHTTKLTSQGKDSGVQASPKTTVTKVSDPAAVRKIEKAQVESGRKKPDEPLKVEYERKTLFPVDDPAGSSPAGGARKTPSPQTAPPGAATSKTANKAQTAPPTQATRKAVQQRPAAPTSVPAVDSSSAHGGSSGGSTFSDAVSRAGNVINIALSNLQNKLMETANSNPDPETAQAMRDINKIIAAKNYLDELKSFEANPGRWTGKKVKGVLIQGVFDHFQGVIQESANGFVARFPGVDDLRRDPLGTGVGLEEYRKKYDAARAALRKPDAAKAFLYLGVALTTQGQPDAVVEARIREANEILARMPSVGEYIRKYQEAQAIYLLVLSYMHEDLEAFNKNLVGQPAEFVEELRRRGAALGKAQVALEEAAQQILPFAVFEPVEEAYFDLNQLADGFGSLSDGFSQLADLVETRKREYASSLEVIEREQKRAGQGIESISF